MKMKNLLKFTPLALLAFLAPVIVSAQSFVTSSARTIIQPSCFGNGIGFLICRIQQLLNSIVPLLITLGVVYLVWGIVQYVIGDAEEAKKKGKDKVIFGIIGLAVIIGIWGLVFLVVNTFGLYGGNQLAPELIPFSPPVVEAGCGDLSQSPKLQNVLGYVTCTINNSVIPFIFAIAVVMFIWGVVQYFILNADEENKRSQGKQFMIWGIIALVVMLSVWSLVAIVGDTLDLNTSGLPEVSPSGP